MKKLFILISLITLVFVCAYAQKPTTQLSKYFQKKEIVKYGYPLVFAKHFYLVTGGQEGLRAYEVIFR